MKRVLKIDAVGVDLTIVIEGTAPPSLARSIGQQIKHVAFDQLGDAGPVFVAETADEEEPG